MPFPSPGACLSHGDFSLASYMTKTIDAETNPIPEYLEGLVSRVEAFVHQNCPGWQEQGWRIDQLTVNDYPLGQGISPHIDRHSIFTVRSRQQMAQALDFHGAQQTANGAGRGSLLLS